MIGEDSHAVDDQRVVVLGAFDDEGTRSHCQEGNYVFGVDGVDVEGKEG